MTDEAQGLSLTQILMGLQKDMAAGFERLGNALDTKASKHDVEKLEQYVRDGMNAHDARLSALEDDRLSQEAVGEHRSIRQEDYRWLATAATGAVIATATAISILLSLVHH